MARSRTTFTKGAKAGPGRPRGSRDRRPRATLEQLFREALALEHEALALEREALAKEQQGRQGVVTVESPLRPERPGKSSSSPRLGAPPREHLQRGPDGGPDHEKRGKNRG